MDNRSLTSLNPSERLRETLLSNALALPRPERCELAAELLEVGLPTEEAFRRDRHSVIIQSGDWPAVDGPDKVELNILSDRFVGLERHFCQRQVAFVQMATCAGLKQIGDCIGHEVTRVWTERSVTVSTMRDQRHGSHRVWGEGSYVSGDEAQDPGYASWVAVSMSRYQAQQFGPVRFSRGGLEVIRPTGLTTYALERWIGEVLRDLSLCRWAYSDVGARRCLEASDVNVEGVRRGHRDENRGFVDAQHIVLIGPQEVERLAFALGDMVLSFASRRARRGLADQVRRLDPRSLGRVGALAPAASNESHGPLARYPSERH